MVQSSTCTTGAILAPTQRPYRVQIDWGMTSANLKTRAVSRCGTKLRTWGLQYDKHGADYDTLKASSENGVRNDRERLVDYHV